MRAGGGFGTRFLRFVAAQCEVGRGIKKNHGRWDEKNPGRWGSVAFLILYVDDILLIGNNTKFLDSIKVYLNKNFQ